MKNIIYLSLIFIACFSSKKNAEGNQDKALTELRKETGDTLFLYFERTICYGECPAYRISVYPDGSCVYEGVAWAEMMGKYAAQLTKEKMREIEDEAERIGFYGLKDKYDEPISDIPSVLLTLSGSKGRKKIHDRAGAPDVLKGFEDYLDKILLGLDWKPL